MHFSLRLVFACCMAFLVASAIANPMVEGVQPLKRQASSATSVAASTIASAKSSITSAVSAAASSASQSAANAASAATASGTAVPSGYPPGGSTGSSGSGDTGGISTTQTKNAGSSIAQDNKLVLLMAGASVVVGSLIMI